MNVVLLWNINLSRISKYNDICTIKSIREEWDTLTLQRNLKIKKRLKKGMSFLQNPLELDLMITLILWSPSSYLPNKEYLVNPSKDNLPKLRHFCLILYNIIIRSRLCHLTSRYRKDPNYENKLKSTGRKTLIKIHFY